MSGSRPIAVFDSGIGGLSVLRHLLAQLPAESFIYLADQAHVPYGGRTNQEIFTFSAGITRFLRAQDAKLIVVACNTATAAALTQLRRQFPDLLFVGMEPAVKPAARHTRSGKVGVLATAGTLSSDRYASLMRRFAQHVTVVEEPCMGLVEQIEAGEIASAATEMLLRRCVQPMLDDGIDTLVLGCTHYPFVQPLLAQILSRHPGITIIDPAPAVARQAVRVLHAQALATHSQQPASLRLLTTGAAAPFSRLARQLIGYQGKIETAVWQNGSLHEVPA